MRALDRYVDVDEGALRRELTARGAQWIDVNPDEWPTVDGIHLGSRDAMRFSETLGRTTANSAAADDSAKRQRLP